MRLDFDIYNRENQAILAGCAVLLSMVYWLLWRKSPKLANWLVFGSLFIVICFQVDWDYALNEYFRIRWKLP